jgi:hypothetical protein
MESKRADVKKSDEALRKIQEIKRKVYSHRSNISRIEREKSDRLSDFDQRIRREQDQIKQYSKQIDDLKRQI